MDVNFLEPSFKQYGVKLLGSFTFLEDLLEFGATGKVRGEG